MIKHNFIIVIPARLNSTRLPRKPLIEILGIPMIIRTYMQCLKVVDKSKVFIATDSKEIVEIANKYNANSILTSKDALTGTDRVAEVSKKINSDYYINIQGDEPLFNPNDINLLISEKDKYPTQVLNGYTEIYDQNKFLNNSIPKVCFDTNENLLYISRSPIPGNKSKSFIKGMRQVCAYCFPKSALKKFVKQTEKTPLENIEDIEILRFLEMGINVKMIRMSSQSISVDHAEDVKIVEDFIINNDFK